jgi:uncharacterized protein YkwD
VTRARAIATEGSALDDLTMQSPLHRAEFLWRAPAIACCMALILAVRASAEPLPPAMQAALDAHNAYRAKHCVPGLTWSARLAASAQQWANRCDFNHDEDSPHGENLFWGTAGAYSSQSAVASWYEEIEAHNFDAPEFSEQTGHFTQVIWRSSKQLGCAKVICQGNDFWVCRYSPSGNVSGQFGRNVPKPCR